MKNFILVFYLFVGHLSHCQSSNNLELNTIADQSYANHLRAQANVDAAEAERLSVHPTYNYYPSKSEEQLEVIRKMAEAGIYNANVNLSNPYNDPNSATGRFLKSKVDTRPSFVEYDTNINDVYVQKNDGLLVPKPEYRNKNKPVEINIDKDVVFLILGIALLFALLISFLIKLK